MKRLVHSFFSAFRFLTIAPVPETWCGDLRALGLSVWFFPAVGMALGGLVALSDMGWMILFHSVQVAAAFDIALMIVLTKALHLDGLCDTADGFLSSKSKEQMLAVMRDSRAGAMGVVAVSSVLLVKWSLIASLPLSIRKEALLLMPLSGRCAPVFLLQRLPYARENGGLASVFVQYRKPGCFAWAFIVLFSISFALLQWMGLVSACAMFAASLLFAWLCKRKIGGFTGDTLGASAEIAEVVSLAAVLACRGQW